MIQLFRMPMKLATSTLTVYLADLPGTVKWPSPIRCRVQEQFDKIVAAGGGFSSASVVWTSRAPKLGPHDLLVYFVESRSDSVVKGLWSGATLGDTGTTVVGTKDVASEVYLQGSQDDPKGLGNVAVHELMHNVTGLRQELHSRPLISLGKEEVTGDTPLVKGDLDLFTQNLKRPRRQWTGGWEYHNDPLK